MRHRLLDTCSILHVEDLPVIIIVVNVVAGDPCSGLTGKTLVEQMRAACHIAVTVKLIAEFHGFRFNIVQHGGRL